MIGLGTIFRENCLKNYYENCTWPVFEFTILLYWGEFRKVPVTKIKSIHNSVRYIFVHKRVLLGKNIKNDEMYGTLEKMY